MTAKQYIYSQHVGGISYSEPELFDYKKQIYLGLDGKRKKGENRLYSSYNQEMNCININ